MKYSAAKKVITSVSRRPTLKARVRHSQSAKRLPASGRFCHCLGASGAVTIAPFQRTARHHRCIAADLEGATRRGARRRSEAQLRALSRLERREEFHLAHAQLT